MNNELVTKAWEVARDTLRGFKEPTRKAMREVDRYVMTLEDDNARLRELVRRMYLTISFCDGNDYPSEGKKREYKELAQGLGVEVN